ncbi:hypothetical protein IIA79_01420 [bacterium]|nr:hypothetical protein [bacterium]
MTRNSEPKTAQEALRRSLSPLMRQIRKFSALTICLELLPEEVAGLAAPFDVRLAPSRETDSKSNTAGNGISDLNTLFIYVASPTVEAVLERRKQELIAGINKQLPVHFVEELRFEVASAKKIERQMNILGLTPD